MRCAKCGGVLTITHDCSGSKTAIATVPTELAPSLRFAPWHYVREAIAIARLDEAAIRRASNDDNSILYGGIFMFMSPLLALLGQALIAGADGHRLMIAIKEGILSGCLLLPMSLISTGLLHLAAKILFHGCGRYPGLIRALWLGSLVTWLGIIPFLGSLIAAFWSFAIFLWIFEEVEGIERIQAIGLSIAMDAILIVTFFFVVA